MAYFQKYNITKTYKNMYIKIFQSQLIDSYSPDSKKQCIFKNFIVLNQFTHLNVHLINSNQPIPIKPRITPRFIVLNQFTHHNVHLINSNQPIPIKPRITALYSFYHLNTRTQSAIYQPILLYHGTRNILRNF